MYIKSLMVHNFKSIDTVQIDFNPMTMIIGENQILLMFSDLLRIL